MLACILLLAQSWTRRRSRSIRIRAKCGNCWRRRATLGLCGAYNWLDCKASYSISPTGPNQPIRLGRVVDPAKGYWEGTNDYAKVGSHGTVQQVAMYSIM